MLTRFVGEAGGGLVYIAGESATEKLFGRKYRTADTLLKLLPVSRGAGYFRLRSEQRLAATTEWRPRVTAESLGDPVFRFADEPRRNERILEHLPAMFWYFPVEREKPGATVLARHSDPRMSNQHGRHVVMATHLYGPGRTIWLGMDSSYRWRFLNDQFYDGFWARVVDRAARGKVLGGNQAFSLSADRTSYAPGGLVTLTARFRSEQDRDSGLDLLAGEVETEEGDVEPITFTPAPGDELAFEAQYRIQRGGPHFVRAWPSDSPQANTKAATLAFRVELPNLELARPSQDRPGLTGLASATGGKVFDLWAFDRIADQIVIGRVPVVDRERQELWKAPVLIALFFLFLFLEWVLRKRYLLV